MTSTLVALMTSALQEWCLSLIKKGFSRLTKEMRISRTFRDCFETAERLLKYENDAFTFENWLKEDLSDVVKEYLKAPNADYFDAIKNAIREKAIECGISGESASDIGEIYAYGFSNYLKHDEPKLLEQLSNESSFNKISLAVYGDAQLQVGIKTDLEKLTSTYREYVFPNEWFSKIESSTRNPSIGIRYFDVDDDDFINGLSRYLNEAFFAVGYYCREEAVGCVCNSLLRLSEKRPILIVRNEKTWEALRAKRPAGMVLLADFESLDAVNAIDGNTCIFFTDERATPNMNVLSLKRRKLSSIRDYLIEAGASSERATSLVEETKGVYYSITNKIANGKAKSYSIKEEYLQVVKLFMLLPHLPIDEEKYGFLGLNEYSGLDYASYKKITSQLTRGADPFIVKRRDWMGTDADYELVSIERSWCQYSYLVEKSDYGAFLDWLTIFFNRTNWNRHNAFTEGFVLNIFRSLAFCGAIINPEWQPMIDAFVEKLLHDALINDRLGDWLENGYLLVHASPEGFLSFLEQHIDDLTSRINNGEIQEFGITNALFHSLTYVGYSTRSLLIAVSLFQNIEQPSSSGPHINEIITEYFIPWFNYSGDTLETIREQAKRLLGYKDPRIWQLIFTSTRTTTSCTMGTRLSYRKENEEHNVKTSDYYRLQSLYFSLLYQNGEPNDWVKMLKNPAFLPEERDMKDMLETLRKESTSIDDHQLFQCALGLFDLVDDARKFERSEYVNRQDFLDYIWNVAAGFTFQNPSYRYLRLFLPEHDYCLKNPLVYRENGTNYFEEERDLIKADRKTLWKAAIQEGRTIDEFLTAIVNEQSNGCSFEIGSTLVLVKDEAFDHDVFDSLVEHRLLDDAATYAASKLGATELNHLINDIQDSDLLLGILLRMNDEKTVLCRLATLEPKIVRGYWETTRTLYYLEDGLIERAIASMEECRAYGSAIATVLLHPNHFGLERVLNLVVKWTGEDQDALRQRDNAYYIRKYLTQNKKTIFEDSSLLYQAFSLELIYGATDGGESIFTDAMFASSPELFVQFLQWAYHSDDGTSTNEPTPKRAQGAFIRLYNSKFCPGVFDGAFDANRFNRWMEETEKLSREKRLLNAFLITVGKSFAFAPHDGDLPLPKEICAYIESRKSTTIENELVVSLRNKRGMFSDTQGRAEKELGDSFESRSAALRNAGYYRTSGVFHKVAITYFQESTAFADAARANL